jgi:hypothetical protein
MNSWSYFSTLLALDYALRFVENLMYTWPPPRFVIGYVTSKLPNSSSNDSSATRKSSNNTIHGMYSERYNEERVQYQDSKELQVMNSRAPSEYSVNSNYGSKITIVSK